MARAVSIHRSLSLRGLELTRGALRNQQGDGKSTAGEETGGGLVKLARELAKDFIAQRISVQDILNGLELGAICKLDKSATVFSFDLCVALAKSLELTPEELAPQYGLKGGAARFILRTELAPVIGPANDFAPRDIDLVRRYGTQRSDDARLMALLNSRDFARGAAVEEIRELNKYFATRDLSINEVIIFGSKGWVTPLGLLDLVGRTLRPSRYRGGSMTKPFALADFTVAKCLRLAAEGDCAAIYPSNAGRPDWIIVGMPESQAVTSLALAVQIKKALERGLETLKCFLQYCIAAGIRFDEGDTSYPLSPAQLIGQILQDLEQGRAFFEAEELALLAQI